MVRCALESERPSGRMVRCALESEQSSGRMVRCALESERPSGRMKRCALESERPSGRMKRCALESERPSGRMVRCALESERPSGRMVRRALESERPSGRMVRCALESGSSSPWMGCRQRRVVWEAPCAALRECFVVLVFAGACGREAAGPPRTSPAPALTAAAVRDASGPAADPIEAAARELVADLSRADFEGATKDFDDTMRAALPEDRLAAVWGEVVDHLGAFVAIEARPPPQAQRLPHRDGAMPLRAGREGGQDRLRRRRTGRRAVLPRRCRSRCRGRLPRTRGRTRSTNARYGSAERRSSPACWRCPGGRGLSALSSWCTDPGRRTPTRPSAARRCSRTSPSGWRAGGSPCSATSSARASIREVWSR